MEKINLILEGLDCPHCASKIEHDVSKLENIGEVNMNFMAKRLTFNSENRNIDELKSKIIDIIHVHEPHVKVFDESEHSHADLCAAHCESCSIASHISQGAGEEEDEKKARRKLLNKVILTGVSGLLTIVSLIIPMAEIYKILMLTVAYILAGYDVIAAAVANIFKGRIFDENFLMTIATVGAIAIGEYPEAAAVMIFYKIGEIFQSAAVNRSRHSIKALMNIRPDYANVKRDGEVMKVSPEGVNVGELILIKPGERVPLDGIVVDGTSTLDVSAITGEPIPADAVIGSHVTSGSVNREGLLTVKVEKPFSESTVNKILDMVQNASSKKAPAENFVTKFARYYTPIVVFAAVLIAVIPPVIAGFDTFTDWIYRALSFLVVSCPCALVISVPLGFFGGIGGASRKGILIKGGNYLDALAAADTVVFDKTGTLTKGNFKVTEVIPSDGFTEKELIELAAYAEYYSTHPMSAPIREAYGQEIDSTRISEYTEIPGKGIAASVDGRKILAGNDKLMSESGIQVDYTGGTGARIYIAENGVYSGLIIISDEIKADSREAILRLKRLGIKRTVMLTGDNEKTAAEVADKIGIDKYHAGLLPTDKPKILEELYLGGKGKTIFAGDGINDAPVLARADIGVAMGGLGSDAAIEASDVVIMTDEPSKLADAITIARRTRRIVTENIVFSIAVKVIVLAAVALGASTMWDAVFADVGVAVIAVLNSIRALKN